MALHVLRRALRRALRGPILLALAALAAGAAGAAGADGANDPRWHATDPVVLVSFDGFRADYLRRYATPNFDRVAAAGLKANGFVPPFPSKTFPSHYSIATGLWVERHGLVGNRFEDPVRGERYDMSDRAAVTDGSWYGGEPIWVTAERQGMVAASYFFVGTEAAIGGVRPTHWQPYDGSVPGEARVDQVLAWLAEPPETRPRLITLYFSDVDSAGHRHGPLSPEVEAAVARVDAHLGRLLDGLRALPDGDRVTLVLVSDHGMHEWTLEDVHPIDLSALPDVRMTATGPYGILRVAGGDSTRVAEVRAAVRAQLHPKIAVHTRADLPPALHYDAGRRSGDVIVLPPLGETVFDAADLPGEGGFTHGWDPAYPAMHGIFVARGPRLKPNKRMAWVRAPDVYPLLCELLGLEPAPNQGRMSIYRSFLLPRETLVVPADVDGGGLAEAHAAEDRAREDRPGGRGHEEEG